MLRKMGAIAFSAAVCLATGAAAQATPPPTLDPKMPPMPSMEAPDANDMTKPAGLGKTTGAAKSPVSKPATASRSPEPPGPAAAKSSKDKKEQATEAAKTGRPVPGAKKPAGKTASRTATKKSATRPAAKKATPKARKGKTRRR